MSTKPIHSCGCDVCQQADPHELKGVHHQMNVLMSRLDEQQRRWYAAVEAKGRGYGGIKEVSQITGLTEKTIKRGMDELETDLSGRPTDKTRLPGGGRPPIEKNARSRNRLTQPGQRGYCWRSHERLVLAAPQFNSDSTRIDPDRSCGVMWSATIPSVAC